MIIIIKYEKERDITQVICIKICIESSGVNLNNLKKFFNVI